MSFQKALVQLAEVEAAIGAGDLRLANSALKELKPMLVSDEITELVTLKAKLAKMQDNVHQEKDTQGRSLRDFNVRKHAASLYRDHLPNLSN